MTPPPLSEPPGRRGRTVIALRRGVAVVWLAVPPLLLSALIHMADPDVDGWLGLGSISVLWSVGVIGAVVAAVAAVLLGLLVRAGRKAFLVGAVVFSIAAGGLLAALGSGATTALGHLRPFAGGSTVVLVTVLVAVVPAFAIGRFRAAGA